MTISANIRRENNRT